MKFSELKSKFKNKYVIRVVAGVLCIAVLGTGYGTYKVSAAKVSPEDVNERIQRKHPRKVMRAKLKMRSAKF